jgi:hypothetical protein
MVLRKYNSDQEYWPRLQKEKGKLNFLKTDFDRWIDEDEQDEKSTDMNDMNFMDFSQMGANFPNPVSKTTYICISFSNMNFL